MTAKRFLQLTAPGAAAMLTSCAGTANDGSIRTKLIRDSETDTLIPVRPGGVGKSPFWNTYAKSFIYVPSFDFPEEKGAASYRFRAEDRFRTLHTFTADSPRALLTPVWKEIPVGPVVLTVDALDKKGKKLRTVGKRVFYRNAFFNDSYPPAARSYVQAAEKAYEYLFSMKEIQGLATGKPDLNFPLFCYPSKMYSAVISGMVSYAEMVPSKKKQALAIACGAADYLMKKSVPAGQVLGSFPQTYEGDKLPAAKKFAGIIMMHYPAAVGSAMIRLAQAAEKPKYLEYAVRIGDRYLHLQQPNGTWYLNLKIAGGTPKEKNYCVPTGIMSFLEKLSAATGQEKYRTAAKKGMPHLRKMVRSFNWEGQFEDVEAQHKPYLNLTFHNAADLYLYLCSRGPVSRKTIQEAREVQRYAEDQFVAWEQPGWTGACNEWNWRTEEELRTEKWGWFPGYHVPGVLEQYRCFVPIDGASAKMIRYYLLMYRLEKNPLDLAKARALGDSLTRLQQEDGRIPTWGDRERPVTEDWINCMYGSANTLKQLADFKE